jgi:hypothetical protein
MPTSSPVPCKSTKVDGNPCKAKARPGSEFCAFHDPAIAAKRAEGRRNGGKQRSRKAVVLPLDTAEVVLKDAAGVTELLGTTINQVRRGELDPKVASCVGYLSNMLMKSLECGDLAKQIEALKAQVAKVMNDTRHSQTASGTIGDAVVGSDLGK